MKQQTIILVLVLVIGVLSVYNLFSLRAIGAQVTGPAVSNTGSGKAAVDFYVMSYCPYGNMAEEGLAPVYNVLKNSVTFSPHYVIYDNYAGGGPDYCLDNGKYCSMHGIQELNQDVRELCVDKYMGMDSYFKFVLAMNSQCSASNADSCWENVAKSLSLDVSKIKSCQSSEATTLLKKEYDLGQQLGVQGSPTVFINSQSYQGGRAPADFQKAICAVLNPKPAGCTAQLSGSAAVASGNCG